MSMDAHVFFCLGYSLGDISNNFWVDILNLTSKEEEILDNYGIAELWEKLNKFLADNNLKETLYSLEDSEYLIGFIYEWDKYEFDKTKLVMNQEDYKKEVERLTSIFSFEPSIYCGVEYY